MHFLNGFSDCLDLLVIKENGLRQLEFQDFTGYLKAGCDSCKGIQEIGIPEMLAGQVDGDWYQRQPFLSPAVYGSAYLCEYIEIQPAYFPIVLEQWYKIRWIYDSFLGMIPAHQCLCSFQPAASESDFGLQINLKIPVFNGVLKKRV